MLSIQASCAHFYIANTGNSAMRRELFYYGLGYCAYESKQIH